MADLSSGEALLSSKAATLVRNRSQAAISGIAPTELRREHLWVLPTPPVNLPAKAQPPAQGTVTAGLVAAYTGPVRRSLQSPYRPAVAGVRLLMDPVHHPVVGTVNHLSLSSSSLGTPSSQWVVFRELGTGRELRGWLRVLLGAHDLDAYKGLVALDPCVMAGRDRVRLTGRDRLLSAVLKSNGDRPGDRIADV